MTKYEALVIFWSLFAAWFGAAFFYSQAIKPYFHDKARFHIFALRDRLRAISCEGPTARNNFRFLEANLNAALNNVSDMNAISFLRFLFAMRRSQGKSVAVVNLVSEYKQFKNTASADFLDIDKQFTRCINSTIFTNSPWVSFFIYITSPLFVKNNDKLREEKRTYIHSASAMQIGPAIHC